MANKFPVKLLLLLLIIDVAAMSFFKMAEQTSHGSGIDYYLSLMSHIWLYTGLSCSILQLLTWTKILARAELSIAYPVSSLAYPLTMLSATLLFKEHLDLKVWLGALLITIGVTIIGLSQFKKTIQKIDVLS